MNINQLKLLIDEGEGLTVEFKEAKDRLPQNFIETVCAFLNTDGGTILLGVADNGKVIGMDPDAVSQVKADLVNLSNNPQKIDPPYLLFPHEFLIDHKMIIAVQVPLSSQLHKTGNAIFLRSEDGDYKVHGTHQLAGVINRKLGLFTEQRTLPFVTINDLRPELFDRARRLMRSYNSQHPWAGLSNEELLQIGGFYAVDKDSGKICLTLAAVLLFGSDLAIQQAVPAFKFDCLLRRENVDRYDDRVMIRTNLIDAYDQMMAFVEKHLNDPFYLEGDMRISLRDKIFREAVSNIISHREYTSAAPARLIIYKDRVLLDNPCVQHYLGEITLKNLRPFLRNPTICKFMIQLGRFDELGSGVTNIYKYLPLYAHGAKPMFKETEHGFELSIPLGEERAGAQPDSQPESQPDSQPESLDQRVIAVLNSQPLSKVEISARLGQKEVSGQLNKVIRLLVSQGMIEYTLPDKPNSRLQKYRLTQKGRG